MPQFENLYRVEMLSVESVCVHVGFIIVGLQKITCLQ